MLGYQQIILDRLNEFRKNNPRRSLRSFAASLDVSASQLSSLLSGRKKLTPQMATNLINDLKLSKKEVELFVQDLLPQQKLKAKRTVKTKKIEQSLSEDQFCLISDWYHFAILSLSTIKNNKADPKWIASRLNITEIQAHQALERLQRLGLVTLHNGQFHQSTKPLTTSSAVPSKAIRQYHKQNMYLAMEKMETVPVDKRIFSSITFATTSANIQKAQKLINKFKDQLCKEIESDQPQEVYTFSQQLFPVTGPGSQE